MKKVILMIFMVGMVGGVVRAGEVRDEDIRFTSKVPVENQQAIRKALHRPVSEAAIPVEKVGNVAPKGYHREGSFYVKNLPISTRHEYYNQFTEGYEPREEFEERMLVKRHPEAMDYLGEPMSQEDIRRREAILANPEYQAKVAKEREWLLNVEKGRISRGGEVRDEDIKFGPKISTLRPSTLRKALYKPVSEAAIPVEKVGNVAPKGYHREGSFYVKNLPISTRHEYYNQFIEGYEPKEEFEEKMLVRRHPEVMEALGEPMSQEDIKRREQILASPEYEAKAAKEREWLLNVEKGNISATRGMMPRPEPTLWSRFTHWLWSFGKTDTRGSMTTIPQQPSYVDMEYTPSQDVRASSRE